MMMMMMVVMVMIAFSEWLTDIVIKVFTVSDKNLEATLICVLHDLISTFWDKNSNFSNLWTCLINQIPFIEWNF